ARSWHAARLYMLRTYTTAALLPMDELLVWSYTPSWQRGGALIAAQAGKLWLCKEASGRTWAGRLRKCADGAGIARTPGFQTRCPQGMELAAPMSAGGDARGKPLLAKWWLVVATKVDGKPAPRRNCWPHRGCARCLAAACLCFMNTHARIAIARRR
ncbi:hypothetical protein Dimus_004367, partial [Dionaea muscipula]